MPSLLALIAAAVFTGAALLVSVAEQPARLALDDWPMLVEWRKSYDRAAPMQGGLALLTGALGIAAWWTGAPACTLAGALLILACWPFVLLVVMPVNYRLQTLAQADAAQARPLIRRWGGYHAIRTALGGAATIAFALALIPRA